MIRLLSRGAAIFLLALGCSSRPERVVVGVGVTSGAYDAVRLAVRQVNAGGGVEGVPMEAVGLDSEAVFDRYDSEEIVKWAGRICAVRDLVGVVGHGDSATTLTAAAVYNRNAVPQIVTVATNPAITNIGSWTYRLCLSDASQGPALAEYAVNVWKKRRVAIVYVNDDYGRGLTQRFELRLRELGAEVVRTVMHRNVLQDDDRESIRGALDAMKTGPPPDLIALFQRVDPALWTIRTIRETGLKSDLLGCDDLAQASVASAEGGLTEGLRVSQFFATDAGDARAAAFARDFRTLTGQDPDYSQAFAYDAVWLLRDAAARGGYSRAGVKEYLDDLIANRTVVRGVGGPFTLGADHDARRALYVAEVRGGQLHILQPVQVR